MPTAGIAKDSGMLSSATCNNPKVSGVDPAMSGSSATLKTQLTSSPLSMMFSGEHTVC
jgi:hypothetical protein